MRTFRPGTRGSRLRGVSLLCTLLILTLAGTALAGGMVVSASPIASQIGIEVMRRGGNAVDASIAVAFALAVVHPSAGNLGGGGFMLIYNAKDGQVTAIDYREQAPLKAHRDMFLGLSGEVDRDRATIGHLSAGVPGTVAGLSLAHNIYGTIPFKELIAPAIKLAEEGFPVPKALSDALKRYEKGLKRFPATTQVFLPKGRGPEPGEILIQKDLAGTLRAIAEEGPEAFYKGKIADLIAKEMEAGGGIITKEDLAIYRPIIRRPLVGSYRGLKITSMPPPSSGGLHLIQMLNILERFDLKRLNRIDALHVMAEAMRRAFADRARFLGDPDFTPVPIGGLISKDYALALAKGIELCCATRSDALEPEDPSRYEGPNTTHFSIIDPYGNAVANTFTLNHPFGSKVVVKGAGFFLNNQMDDFSAKPGAIGSEANAIAPKKRMLSSMAPTFLFKGERLFLIIGASGGVRIITSLLQIIVNVVDYGMGIREATAQPRIHHQWMPDKLFVEEMDKDIMEGLKAKGHKIDIEERPISIAHSIGIDGEGRLTGAPDPRGPGAVAEEVR